jgi:hypothetical protein
MITASLTNLESVQMLTTMPVKLVLLPDSSTENGGKLVNIRFGYNTASSQPQFGFPESQYQRLPC